jgi:signal transduction histidine kinase
MLGALLLVILVAWLISISMFMAYLHAGRANFWHSHLDSLGNHLVNVLPDSWKNEAYERWQLLQKEGDKVAPAAAANDSARAQLDLVRRDSSNPGGILTALVLNTIELAIVGLLMWWAAIASLRPLKELSAAIGKRKPFDSDLLPVRRLPTELRPLIVAFNALLKRVDDAMRVEHRFIEDAAHELRTPLAALHVQAEVALRAQTMSAKDDALRKLLDVSRRSHRLAEQLLDLARLDAGLHNSTIHPTDLRALAGYVVDECRMQAANRGVQLSLSGSSCYAKCDVDEMGILIRNLVDNAIRHGRENGAVEVHCGYTMRDHGRCPMLEVKDDGSGVPDEERDAIFARFYRAAGSGAQGSGIGLSLVAGIAELHNATIETGKGDDGHGFCVRVVFPPES